MSKNEAVNKQDAINFVRQFYTNSYNWVNQGFAARWDKLQNAYHSIYPQEIKNRKEGWQSCLYVPETFKVVEVIAAALTKTIFSRRHPVSLDPRERGDELQAELNTDLLSYELERSNFATVFYDVLKEALIYGSGFMKLYWLQKKDKRRIKVVDQRYGMMDELKSGFQIKAGTPKSYKEEIQDIYVKENVQAERVHIRDIFLEPNSTDMQRVLHRTKITFGELLDLAKQGFIDKEAVEELRDLEETSGFESSLKVNQTDGRDLSQKRYDADAVNAPGDPPSNTYPRPVRAQFDRAHSVWEMWAPVPRRFIDLSLDPESDKANEIVPGKILLASGCKFLGAEENPNQSMQPPFLQLSYCRTGGTYGKGVAQMIEGLQEDLNEITNQRIDNVSLIMNKMFVVIEKALVDSGELVSSPGGGIRLKGNPNEMDIQKVFKTIDWPDITRSAYIETQERERQIQEVSAANRVTIGTADRSNDTNQTLGGMELLKQSAEARFMVYAYIIGQTFLIPAATKYIELIYQHYGPERIQKVLGDMPVELLPGEIVARWQAFKPQAPHELCEDYNLVPVDVFSEEDKMRKKMSLANNMQLTAGLLPASNPYPGLKKLYRYDGFENDEILEILGEEQGMLPTPMQNGQGQPSMPQLQEGGPGAPPPPASMFGA